MKRSRRFFSLLEIMVTLVLLGIASGVIGLKMHKAVERKHFESQLDRLQERLTTTQKIALSMQADWRSVLRREGKEWVFETCCDEGQSFPPLRLSSVEIRFNGKKVERLEIDFFASGKVLPEGTVQFAQKEHKKEWRMETLFSRREGEKEGPKYPPLRK